jgi:hypothetical protein
MYVGKSGVFSRVSETELPSVGRDFICRIMKMEPTAKADP